MTHENRIHKDRIVFEENGNGEICLGNSHCNISFSLLQLISGRNICEIKPDKDNTTICTTENERKALSEMNLRILTCVECTTAWGNKHNYWSQ